MSRQCTKKGRKRQLQLEYCNIKAILDEIHVPYTETGKNVSIGWIGVRCPMPGCGDHSNHMGINLKSPVVSCYNCGRSGNYLTYLAAEMGSWDKAIEIILKNTPRELRVNSDDIVEHENNVNIVKMPQESSRVAGKQHIKYLKKRKFDHKELEILYDLHYCENEGKWANRIIVPIYQRNRLVTFTSVDTAEESHLRYKHLAKELSIIHCKELLYGIEQVIGKTIIVVEGYFDKLRVGPGSVCTFGTKVTSAQKKLLAGYDKVVILFDGDEPGRVNGRKLANDLSAFTEVELMHLPDGVDPDKMDKGDLKEIQNIVRRRW